MRHDARHNRPPNSHSGQSLPAYIVDHPASDLIKRETEVGRTPRNLSRWYLSYGVFGPSGDRPSLFFAAPRAPPSELFDARTTAAVGPPTETTARIEATNALPNIPTIAEAAMPTRATISAPHWPQFIRASAPSARALSRLRRCSACVSVQ